MDPYKTEPHHYRIVFFTKNKSRTRYTMHIIEAMRRLGCTVLHINIHRYKRWIGRRMLDRLLRRWVDRFEPDAVFVFSSDILEETLEYLAGRYRTAHLLDDYFSVDAGVTEKIKMVDVFFHTQRGQIEEYRKAGVKKPVFVPNGVDDRVHHPGRFDPALASDVAFTGQVYPGERVELLEAVDRAFDLKVYGQGWGQTKIRAARKSIGALEFTRLCASVKVFLGIDKAKDLELYFSNRTWFALGCHAFLLTRYVKGLEQVFANHVHLVWYEDQEECLELLRFYLEHEELRATIAAKGYRFVHDFYPNERMAESMIRVLLEDGPLPTLTEPGPGFASGEQALAALETQKSLGPRQSCP